LRRTKDYILDGKPIITLPKKTLNEESTFFKIDQEREFYETLEKKAQMQFNQYFREGTVMKNYHHVLAWILRLRQAW
jgi:hypothetical protein